jgi:hypothetical protein
VGRAIDDQQINREQVAEVDGLVDLGRGGQFGVLRIAAVIQDSAEAPSDLVFTAPEGDVYAGLFADDLDGVADRLDRAFMKLNADQMRIARRPSQSNPGVLPFEYSPEQAAD